MLYARTVTQLSRTVSVCAQPAATDQNRGDLCEGAPDAANVTEL